MTNDARAQPVATPAEPSWEFAVRVFDEWRRTLKHGMFPDSEGLRFMHLAKATAGPRSVPPPAADKELVGVIAKCKFCGTEIAHDRCEFGEWMDRETGHTCARGPNRNKPHAPKRMTDE